MLKKSMLFLVLSILSASLLLADEPQIIFEAGGGVMYDSGIYKGDKNSFSPLPLINARYGRFTFEYDRAKCYINDDLAVVVGMGNSGYDSIEGMDDRDMAITAGLDYKLKVHDDISARFKINENFFDSKTSLSGEIGVEKEISITESDFLSLSCNAKFIGSTLSNYYYGVKESEATVDRKSYKARGTVITEVGFDYIRVITPNIYLLASGRCEGYTQEITDSPIVDRGINVNTIVGVLYKFK